MAELKPRPIRPAANPRPMPPRPMDRPVTQVNPVTVETARRVLWVTAIAMAISCGIITTAPIIAMINKLPNVNQNQQAMVA